MMKLRIAFLILLCGSLTTLLAMPDTSRQQVDIRRAKLHENINLEQQRALQTLVQFRPGSDDALSDIARQSLMTTVDVLQDSLETSSSLDHRLKVKYLSGIENFLKGYNTAWRAKTLQASQVPLLVDSYRALMQEDLQGTDIRGTVSMLPFEIGNIHVNLPGSSFYENPGFQASKEILFRKFCAIYPDQTLQRLEYFSNVAFADSLLTVSAKRNPEQFYDYAAASRTRVGQLIRQSRDPLVQTITRMASSREGQQYFPFLDEIYNGRLTFEEVDRASQDSLQYYRLLVKTQVAYTTRMAQKDTPIGTQKLVDKLRNRAERVFINEINALHDEPDPVRFRILEPLTPEELYYLIVLGEDVIYTSSYKGVYNRMMQRMRKPAGDTLLMSVRFDRFKKFIKMAAGYNKLDEFLGTMPDSSAQRLMIAFVRGLEKSGTLEEAVDVADSYGSIQNARVKKLIDLEIKRSLDQSRGLSQKRTYTIYDILQTIFLSSTDSTIDLSRKLGIPPVYRVDYQDLVKDSGQQIVQLVFFYGDKDGQDSYVNFMGMFNGNADWRVNRTPEWVEIRSARGKPVVIYANLPLDNSKGDDPDARAQEHLIRHLEQKGLEPDVVIHRGHSYHVQYTIKQLPPSAKIVILGSCGGYHNLDDVLKTSPDAHIISSKEVGTRTVNEPILKAINEDLRNGRNVDWIAMWKQLSLQFPGGDARERFENYIPPHKNLGALFIKAYTRQMGDN